MSESEDRDYRYEDLRDELNWDQAQADMIEDLRDEALALEAHEKVAAAFAAMDLAFLEDSTRQLIERQVRQFVDQSASAGSDQPPLTDEEWTEIQEQESLAVDDRLELEAIRAQAEFAEALVKMKNPFASDADHFNAEYLQEKAEEALRKFDERRARRRGNEALQYEIVQAVKKRAWSREEFADKAGVSLSTVRNLMVSTDPDRRWRVGIQRAVEDALDWPRGTFESILETGKFPGEAEPAAGTGPPPLDPAIRDQLESIAIREGRSINAVLGDAIRVYLKVYGPGD